METFNVQKYYEQLVGAQIVAFQLVKYDDQEDWPTFVLKKGNTIFTAIISMDHEGNGPGVIQIHRESKK